VRLAALCRLEPFPPARAFFPTLVLQDLPFSFIPPPPDLPDGLPPSYSKNNAHFFPLSLSRNPVDCLCYVPSEMTLLFFLRCRAEHCYLKLFSFPQHHASSAFFRTLFKASTAIFPIPFDGSMKISLWLSLMSSHSTEFFDPFFLLCAVLSIWRAMATVVFHGGFYADYAGMSPYALQTLTLLSGCVVPYMVNLNTLPHLDFRGTPIGAVLVQVLVQAFLICKRKVNPCLSEKLLLSSVKECSRSLPSPYLD